MFLTSDIAIVILLMVNIVYCQIDEERRRRNPYEFFQIGPEIPAKQYLYYTDNGQNPVPPPGTSDFVRYFARQTSGKNLKNKLQSPLVLLSDSDVREPTVRRLPLIDSDVVEGHDPHASHRNFVAAGNNRYYSVQTPPAHELQAPIVGHYHSSYEDRDKGGKMYLGNHAFHF
ncbi:uncharacterized protein LOC128961401 [Oppia nitens]|uniref:uncharacterized protein LOC128961401 n=1 Tax=Oppia nitens TaxID=1686743 RepID=UPI0023DA06D9|nr:uncharacterized protein LOC128961401 [Oppia nitens]